MIHMIYLAAGNSRRFSSNKLLAEFQGKALYCHGLELLLEALKGNRETTLTVASQYPELLNTVESRWAALLHSDLTDRKENKRVSAVFNPDSYKGASYTIRKALESIRQRYPGNLTDQDSLLFFVADQPLLRQESLEKMLSCGERMEADLAWSMKYGDQVGNPVLFSASFLPVLEALEGDRGGRNILKKRPVSYVEATEKNELYDIDTLEDLQKLEQELKVL